MRASGGDAPMDPSNANANANGKRPDATNGDVVLIMPPEQPQQPTVADAPNAPSPPNPEKPPPRPHLPNPEKPPQSPAQPPLPPAQGVLLHRRSSLSKPKSRFVKPPTPPAPASHLSPAHPASTTQTPRPASTPQTPGEGGDDDDVFRKDGAPAATTAAKCRRRACISLELAVLVLFLALLVVSLVARPAGTNN